MKKYLTSIFLLFSLSMVSQGLTVKETILNPSNHINDGVIKVEVEGGTPPYQYKWSNQDTALTSNEASGLIEGLPYTVTITDAKGLSVIKEYKVPSDAITEVFNGIMTPAVSVLGSFLFWDPFDAIGIYDPVIYADVKQVGVPNWSPAVRDKFILKKWLRPEGQQVREGDQIAILSRNDGATDTIVSPAKG